MPARATRGASGSPGSEPTLDLTEVRKQIDAFQAAGQRLNDSLTRKFADGWVPVVSS